MRRKPLTTVNDKISLRRKPLGIETYTSAKRHWNRTKVKETRKLESRMMRQVSSPVRRRAGRKGRKDLARSLSCNVTPTGVTNAANLALFMVNVAYRLQDDVRQRAPDYSILDFKADCRGSKYVEETIQMLPEKPEPVLLAKILNQVTSLGRIHLSQPSFRFAELAMVLIMEPVCMACSISCALICL